MDWNGRINEGEALGGGVDIAPGVYPCKILSVEQEYTKKEPKRLMAVLLVQIENEAEEYANLKDYVVLSKATDWKIRQVHEGLGLVEKGAGFDFLWTKMPGISAYVKIKSEKYKDKEGNERTRASIDHYLPAAPADEDEESPI